jgi:DNA-binding transcriptional LysR family regulator
MDTILGIKTIIAVVETGSFTAAGDRLSISKALVSKYVGIVEEQLGVRLFNRSTRKISITEAGKNYYERVVPLFDDYSELVDNLAEHETSPRGQLRISAPVTFGESNLAPLLPELINRYPDLSVDLHLSDKVIDMLEEGIDLVVRIGGVDDSNLIARKITSFPLIMCASPAYLEKHGYPTNAQELEQHTTIIDSNFRIGFNWPLISKSGEPSVAHVKSHISANSPRAVKEVVLASGGIGLIPEFVIEEQLRSGELLRVMDNHKTLEFGMFAIYPHRKFVPRKVRTMVDFLIEKFS